MDTRKRAHATPPGYRPSVSSHRNRFSPSTSSSGASVPGDSAGAEATTGSAIGTFPDGASGPLPPALRQQFDLLAKEAHDAERDASRQPLSRRQPACSPSGLQSSEQASAGGVEESATFMPLSRTTERVLRMLLDGDLSRLRSESVAESLGISCTTLRRRLRCDHTSYQFLLDRARQYRCESRLRERWLPGKCLADELGYLEVNSFYRAFRRWTGISYSEYRQRYH